MWAKQLEARVRYCSGVPVIELHGELDAMSDTVLQAAYTETARHNAGSAILLNFSGVRYLRRSGLALPVSLRVQTRNTQLIIFFSPAVKILLQST